MKNCKDSYCKIMFEFVDELTTAEQKDEIMFFNIEQLFDKVLDFHKIRHSFSIFWHMDLNFDDELSVAYYESSVVSKKEFEVTLEKVKKQFDNRFVSSPGAIDAPVPAIAIPIRSAYTVFGYALVFFHESPAPYTVDCPKIKFLHMAMRIVACICQELYSKEKFEYYLMNDFLTELPNRTYLYESIVHSLQTAEVFKTRFALLIIKINGLKHINNSLGITTGDLMLKETGLMIQSAVTLPDLSSGVLVGRLSGGDFVVLITFPAENENEEDDAAIAERYCEAILEKTKDHIEINGYKLYPSLDIGVSIFPYHGERAEELLRKADTAKGLARQGSPNSYKIYTNLMEGDSDKALFLSNSLQTAISENQFELLYQAQIDIKTELIVGAEALIRWHHPEKGMISPGDFIPFAEKNGYSVQMDMLVLDMACNQINKWCDMGFDLSVSVNISPKHFVNGLIYDSVSKVLNGKSVDPSKLRVELLESAILEDFDITVKVIKNLRALGVAIALDDFGSGYSSLEYVAKLPTDYLKIDRTFSMNLMENPSNKIILGTVMTLAEGMKVKTVAEGVETQGQFDFLKSIGCDFAQGYFINKPMHAGDFETLLKKNRYGQI